MFHVKRMSDERSTIFALSSAPGRAGIAVFRLSGPAAAPALAALAGGLPVPRRASLRRLAAPAGGGEIDRALVLWLPGPASFTGEDMAELHAHGGRAVTAALIDALAALPGLRPAEPGEFTRRAFANGRLDLTEAEGIADLINAETEAQRRQAVRQIEGEAGRLYEGWRARAMRALAWLEAALDFADEADLPATLADAAVADAVAVGAEIGAFLDDARRGERLREGVRVVIAGPPNAGKSTLMNALARREVAIVSARAGTTRDVIEVHLDLAGLPVTLTDTAGLREAADEIEEEGVHRARAALHGADLIVWLAPADEPAGEAPAPAPGQRQLCVRSKADLAADGAAPGGEALAGDMLAVSVISGLGVERLIARLGEEAAQLCGRGEAPAITRARHRAALETAHGALARFGAARAGGEPALELLAEELRAAVAALGRITGRVDVEDLLDIVFADFCIGK